MCASISFFSSTSFQIQAMEVDDSQDDSGSLPLPSLGRKRTAHTPATASISTSYSSLLVAAKARVTAPYTGPSLEELGLKARKIIARYASGSCTGSTQCLPGASTSSLSWRTGLTGRMLALCRNVRLMLVILLIILFILSIWCFKIQF